MMIYSMIIVTYNPDIDILTEVIESIINQIDKIVIVDNGSVNVLGISKICSKSHHIRLIKLNANLGIAYATNRGLESQEVNSSNFVIISDQDTIYPKDYISRANYIISEYNNTNRKIGAYAPLFYDNITNEYAPFIVDGFLFKKRYPITPYTDLVQAIASGMVIDVTALRTIGYMNESLFIDWVDLEWCWKARYRGYELIGCRDLKINHRLGDISKNTGFRKVNVRSHIRSYYITRNSVYLSLNTKYLSFIKKFFLFIKSFQYIVGYTFLCDEHYLNFKYTTLGFYHGVVGKMGSIHEKTLKRF